jgi:lambda family phage portal protein
MTASGVLDARGQPIGVAEVRRVRAEANRDGWGLTGHAFEGSGHRGQFLERWRTSIQSPDLEYLPARDILVARARDLARNEPVAGAAIARRKNSAVGSGWRLSAKPNARALGIAPEAAAELAAKLETEFNLYANGHAFQCDAERKVTFGQQLRIAMHGLVGPDGEGVGVCELAADEGTRYATRLRIVDPDRLANPIGRINDAFFRSGVEHNDRGQPIRYWFREAHPADYVWNGDAFRFRPVERFTPWGSLQVFHWFDPERAAQSRGVSRFVQVLKSFRAFSKFTDFTLQNAALNALKVGFVYSSAGPDAVGDALGIKDIRDIETARQSWYDQHPVTDADEAAYSVLPYGDKVEMATTSRQVTGYDAFTRAIVRLIASALGVTYEEVSMDYSQTNYSSARAALIHAWAETQAVQGILEAQLVRPFYVRFLEETFDRGFVTVPAGAPDFWDAVDAYAEARWIGPPRGYIDPVKEVLAAAARIELGITTMDDECAANGTYWEDQMYQQARENALRQKLGLQPADSAIAQAIEDTKNPAKAAPKPTDAEGEPAPEDVPPAKPAESPDGSAGASAMARLRAIALSPEHDLSLDARPSLAA